MARQRDITFYLVKEDVVDFADVLPNTPDTSSIELDALPYEGRLLVKNPRSTQPWWISWLQATLNDVPDLQNTSTSGALVLRAAGRLFVATFGYGRNLMSLDCFERDFGLRVALNIVDPSSLRSVDARTFEQLTVTTRRQTSRSAALSSFRLSLAEDIVKGVTGTPRDTTIGSRITGGDAAKVTHLPSLTRLHEKCSQLLNAYHSHAYRDEFGFIDNLRITRDPVQIARLNGELLTKLHERHFGAIHMAPPDVTDLQDIDEFLFDAFPNTPLLDLDIELYCENVAQRYHGFTVERLRRSKVGVTYRGTADVHYHWSAFDCLVAEIRHAPHLFVLSGGTWYQIEESFAEQVGEAVRNRTSERQSLPVGRLQETEANYNSRASQEGHMHLLDGCLASPQGARSQIEFCDLLDDNRRMVHVKRRSRSSTLSHLFAQGVVAAETFLRDDTFRAALAHKLRERGQNEAARLVNDGRPIPREWTVVYAIVERGANEAGELPFFSQLNFKLAAERLENSQLSVALVQIPVGQ